MGKILDEYRFFSQQPRQMRMLLGTNMVYALAIPIIELFVSAYIIRSSRDFSLVIVYQLAQGTGIPLTFMINAYLLRYFPIARIYSIGMVLSGLSMLLMMTLGALSFSGVAITGFLMGLAYGLFWANRVFLALTNTNNHNRNYYYGLEALFFTIASIVMPLAVGYFLASPKALGWLNGNITSAYLCIAGFVVLLTSCASFIAHKGKFKNPVTAKFLYLKFHRLWQKMLLMASMKGLAQGFVIAAPVMLIMKLVGNEGSLGTIQSIGSCLSAIALYILGRISVPKHRIKIFIAGLSLFCLGATVNMIFYSATGAIFFVGCLVFGRPLMDLAYFPIQLGVIECVAAKEKRSQFAYLFSHEVGLYVGRLLGCLSFIIVARNISEEAALRYALFGVAFLQLFAMFVAKAIMHDKEWCEASDRQPISVNELKEPTELTI